VLQSTVLCSEQKTDNMLRKLKKLCFVLIDVEGHVSVPTHQKYRVCVNMIPAIVALLPELSGYLRLVIDVVYLLDLQVCNCMKKVAAGC
jgi:hypothetical protein